MSAQHEQLRTILTAGDRLDDITRARMWSQLEDQVAPPDAAPAGPAIWKRTAAIAFGGVAIAATLLLVLRATRSVDEPDGRLAVAADSTLSTRLGPHARSALVGPAQVQLLGPAGDATSVRLDRGTLLAEFTGGTGRSLRIEAADLVVEIVGTLFAVDVTDGRACVAVAHGTVRVTRGSASSLVTDRQQLCSGDAATHAIPPEVADQLARHEQSLQLAVNPVVNPITAPRTTSTTTSAPPTATSSMTTSGTAPATASATPTAAPRATTGPPTAAPTTAPPLTPTIADAPRTSSSSPTTRTTTTPPTAAPTTAPPTAAATAPTAPIPSGAPRTSTTPSAASTASAEAAPAAPATPAAPAASAPLSADELYRTAERALAAGDRAGADRALAQVIALGGSLADQALYERARIAYQARAWQAARAHLAALAAIAGTPLAEPGRYLDCRIAVEARAADAERCFAAYRAAYPRSPHDLDVLAVLAQLAHARGGCTAARPLRDELVTRYPRTDHAAAWRSRCPEAP